MHECVICFLFVFSFIQMALEGFDNLHVVSTLYSLVQENRGWEYVSYNNAVEISMFVSSHDFLANHRCGTEVQFLSC